MRTDHSKAYGYSRGVYWVRTSSGLQCSYRDRERFRYALRNEHGMPGPAADAVVQACDDEKGAR
jgi:hypothetical protein